MAKRKRARRARGSGYATQTINKTWIAYFPRRGGYLVRRGFDSRASAESWLDTLTTRQANKEDIASGQQRVSTWLDNWASRAARDRGWKAKTTADVAWKLGYVKPHLGDHALADVTPDDIDAMLDDLAQSLAETTMRQIRNYLYQVFEAAVRRHYITYNPVIKPERRRRPAQHEPQRLSAAQTIQVLRAAEGSFYALAWWIVFVLGLRAAEICGLRWGDIDLDTATVTIAQQATDVRGKVTRYSPKSGKTRVLPLPRALVPLLAVHKTAVTRRAAEGLRRGYWQQNGLVFPGRGGRPMHTTSLRHQFKRLTDACKLPPITTHEARHTAAKFYTDIGSPENVTRAIVGHAPTMTGHYARVDAEAMRPWVERVYGLLVGERERAVRVVER